MKKIEEIMTMVDSYGHAVVALDNAKSNGDIQKALAVADSAHKSIESALRELVERKPLSEQEAETVIRDCDYDPMAVLRITEHVCGVSNAKKD